MPLHKQITYIFFGSSEMSTYVLDELIKGGLTPRAIVTTPDKPQGRKLALTPNVVKVWATEKNIRVYDFVKLDQTAIDTLKKKDVDLFIVASYGKLIPESILSIPPKKTLNVHPSLLPKYRGASPLQSAILDDNKDTGVSIMRIDEQMDHGPLIAQNEIHITEWPTYEVFEEMMAREGGRMLVQILPDWVAGDVQEKEQDHLVATHSNKFSKEDGELPFEKGHIAGDHYLAFRKIQAFHRWPGTFFYIENPRVDGGKKIRVKITSARYSNGTLILERVIPEGGKEMDFSSFTRGYLGM